LSLTAPYSGAALSYPDVTLGDGWKQRQRIGTGCCGDGLYIKNSEYIVILHVMLGAWQAKWLMAT
jgi:hypothetical protein